MQVRESTRPCPRRASQGSQSLSLLEKTRPRFFFGWLTSDDFFPFGRGRAPS